MTRRSYFWLLCAVSLLLTLRSVYQIGKTLLAGGMTGLLPNAILLVCLIAVDGYLLWSALRAAPAVEAQKQHVELTRNIVQRFNGI
ncbi:hypothetical protein B5F94_12615, partial [Flavonifractor sp. An4]